jgi:RNA polymerase primary sigma factor
MAAEISQGAKRVEGILALMRMEPYSLDALVGDKKDDDGSPLIDFIEGDDGMGPVRQLQRDGIKNALDNYIAGLSERERAVIRARFYDDIRSDEIARDMQIGVPKVREIEKRAIRMLRGRIGKDERFHGYSSAYTAI